VRRVGAFLKDLGSCVRRVGAFLKDLGSCVRRVGAFSFLGTAKRKNTGQPAIYSTCSNGNVALRAISAVDYE
jgi:hypothetical protein